MHSEILKPVVILAGWSLIMLVWAVAVRLPALKKIGIDVNKVRGSRPGALDGVVPDQAQWPVHNYNHLMEQPTLFYAVALAIAISGNGNGHSVWAAWGYVVFRIAHSVWQATVNLVSIRFLLFLVSTLCLAALIVHAAMVIFHLYG